MAYVKVVLVGIGGAIVAVFLWVLCAFVLPLYLPMLLHPNEGGASAAAIGSGSILTAAVIGFAAGVAWALRRIRKQPQ